MARQTYARLSDRIESLAEALLRGAETSPAVIWVEPGEDIELHENQIPAGARQVLVVSWSGLGCGRSRPDFCTARSLSPYVPVVRDKIAHCAAGKWATVTPEGQEYLRALDEHWRNLCRHFEINYDECA
jgi:hypothetical protein